VYTFALTGFLTDSGNKCCSRNFSPLPDANCYLV